MNNNPGYVTAFDLNSPSLRNDFSGFVGTQLTVGSSPLSVTSVGRACFAGNSRSHTVKIVQAATGADVASAMVDMSNCTLGQFAYASLASAVTLQPGARYYLVSQETAGGDTWYNHVAIATTNVATVSNSIWSPDGTHWNLIDGPNTAFVPPDFIYAVLPPASPTPFVADFNLNNVALRSDVTGFVGMQLAVHSSAITVAQIGRACAPGNSATHLVEFINAATKAVVPNSAVMVNMWGCTPGQFVYTNPGGSVMLQPNTTYYLVSQETNGGDQFYNHGSITTTGVVSVSNSIWSPDGANWNAIDGANSSYGPVNFKY